MLKEAVASKAAKLLMTCVCPVAGTTALTLGVPQVRDAVHKAVQPRQYAKPKTRVRPTQLAAAEVATAEGCPTVTPFAISDMPADAGMAGANALSQVVAASQQPDHLAQPGAEAPRPESGVLLTQRIFVSPSDGASLANPSDSPETSTWVQLVLGFGLIGVPRVRYRRNDAQPSG